MGSIPLPALDVRPPQQPDTMADVSKLMALKGMMAQQQTQKLQQDALGQENQQRQLALNDQQVLRESSKGIDWSQPDAFGQLIGNAQKQGVSPQTLSSLSLQRAQYQEQLAKTDTATLAAEKERNSQFQGHIDAIKGITDPAKRQQAAQMQGDQILQGGLAKTPQMQQLATQMKAGQYVPTDDQLKSLEDGLTDHNTQIEQTLKKQQTQTSAAQQGEAQATAEQKRMESAWYQQHGGAPGVPVEGQEMSDFLQKHPGKSPSDFVVWKAQHSPSVILQGGSTAQGDPMVDMVGQNRVDLATTLQRMSPVAKESFMKALNEKYPGYNQGSFGVEKKVQEDFTSGDAAKNLTAFNTAIEHATQLKSAASALDNGDIRGLNKIGNTLGYQFGSDKTTNFGVIKSALSGEISKVFKGGQATDAEIKSVQEPFDSANSPDQLKGAIDNAIHLMNSKRDNLKKQYENGKQGKPNFGNDQQGGDKPDFFAQYGGKARQ